MPIASPRMYTSAWSAMVAGFVIKKKPKVIWKREMEVRIVRADIRAIVGMAVGRTQTDRLALIRLIFLVFSFAVSWTRSGWFSCVDGWSTRGFKLILRCRKVRWAKMVKCLEGEKNDKRTKGKKSFGLEAQRCKGFASVERKKERKKGRKKSKEERERIIQVSHPSRGKKSALGEFLLLVTTYVCFKGQRLWRRGGVGKTQGYHLGSRETLLGVGFWDEKFVCYVGT
jgi:hypothetical protein